MPEESESSGALRSIDKIEELPARLAEAILEGLAKEPSKYIVMAFGFYLGWKGIDVMKYLWNYVVTPEDAATIEALVDAKIQMEKISIIPGAPLIKVLEVLGGGSGSLIGAVSGPIAGTGLAGAVTTEELTEADVPKATMFKHEVEVRIIAGMIGAITATMVTTPGFFAGIGEIIKGFGEIVPL